MNEFMDISNMGIFGRKKNKALGQSPPNEYDELGTIRYANLTADGRHGDYETALDISAETGKPIFANFVEWSG